MTLPATVSVNGTEMLGALVELLPEHPPTPTPVSLLYPRDRQLSPRVRVFIDWLMREFTSRRDDKRFIG